VYDLLLFCMMMNFGLCLNYERQAVHVGTLNFSRLRMIRLAAGSELLGVVLLLLFFFRGWLVSDVVVFGLNSHEEVLLQ